MISEGIHHLKEALLGLTSVNQLRSLTGTDMDHSKGATRYGFRGQKVCSRNT